jgi:hypothetical protein
MSFFSFIKKIFVGEKVDEAALDAARARHGIKIDAKTKAAADKPTTEAERSMANFDAWEELKHWRSYFFLGGWVTRKFHPIGEDKVKKQLEELEKKRQAEAEQKKEKEEGEKG